MDNQDMERIAAEVSGRLGVEGLRDWLAAVDRREDELRDRVDDLERRLEELARAVYHPGGD